MPATPLHCSIAFIMKRWKPQLSLPALLVGTILPDLEIPFTYLMTDGDYHRLFLHSFLGAATVGTFLSVSSTVFLYPSVVSFFSNLTKKRLGRNAAFLPP